MPRHERLISLAPSNTEILYELGVEGRVVATTAVCDYPEGAVEKPSVGGWTNPDIDTVKEHEPDLVLATDELQDEAVERCEAEGLNVKQFTPTRLHDVFNTIKAIGELVERERKAWELVEEMNGRVRGLAAMTTEKEPRVYCEEWHEPPMIGGNWVPRMVDMVGGEYLIEEGERSREVSTEEMVAFNPEHIVLHYCGFSDEAVPEQVLEREGWQDITAVQEGNVHVIDDSLLNRPGPRLIEGMWELKKILSDE